MGLHERWWTDVEKAQRVLAIVGGDDVAQSVGTVALGYHAVLADRLRPLASSTLVDQADVANALEEVDLTPVAKAMSNAVSPVLGSAAEPYAADLVANLHEEARDGIRHELQVLTAKGVAWPQAIERICGVAGVPARAVNGYVQKVATPQVNPRVLADEGDRTLMTWASRLGKREATSPLEDVAKQRERDWDPQEHPRDAEGQFAEAPGGAREARRARLSRIGRLANLQALTQRQQQEEQKRREEAELKREAERKSLADLQAEVLGRPQRNLRPQRSTRPQQGARPQRELRPQRQARPQQEQKSRQLAVREEEPPPIRSARRGLQTGLAIPGFAYMDVDPENILLWHKSDVVSGADIARSGGLANTDPDVQEHGSMRVRIEGGIADEDYQDGTYELDPNYDYQVTDIGFDGIHQYAVLERVKDPDEVGKADWEEQEHPRDDDGRFTEAADARQRRLSRIQRMQNIGARQAQAQAQAQQAARDRQEQEEVAREVLARPQRDARPQRGRLQRTGRPQRDTRPQAARRGQVRVRPETQVAAEVVGELAGRHAMVIDESAFAQLTGYYSGEDAFDLGIDISSVEGRDANDLRRLLKKTSFVRGEQVSQLLAADAMKQINRRSRDREPMVDVERTFDTPQEAMEVAEYLLGGVTGTLEQGRIEVPGVQRTADRKYHPAIYEQPLREPKHVITGSDAAMAKLRSGQTRGLQIRRVDEQMNARDFERMGGGSHEEKANVYLNADVFEVVDVSDRRWRRA